MLVTDCHCHIYPEKIASRAVEGVGSFYQIEMRTKTGTADSLIEACEGSPIKRHIVHSVATRADQVQNINDFIAGECEAHPEFVGFMTLHQDTQDMEAEIERACGLGLRGIKLHPDTQKVNMDDPRLYPIYEIAQAKGLPIIMHVGDYRYGFSHPQRMKRILDDFPDLTVDAAHFGGWSIFDLGLEILQDANCFVDASSAMEFLGLRRTRELCRAYGTHRVMFGSDFPMWDPVSELDRFMQAGFTDDELEQMLKLNASRFLGEA
ncbi:MAG: amidohydrolase family protein [Eggerthellaceae bacterium]|nr:amidohydrolase family protein [Eggerthellaceae bacterium]